jgi:hypothetical protein
MRTTSRARARKPALLLAAIVAVVGAIACSDVATTAPSPSATNQVGAPDAPAASGYALASGKSDSTKKK